MQPQILWFRQDLRLTDQPALRAAAAAGPIIPIYILDDQAGGAWSMGGASRWWLHHSLASLDADLRQKGARLILLRGQTLPILQQLIQTTGAKTIHATGHFEPWERRHEQILLRQGQLTLHGTVTLADPTRVVSKSGGSFKVFTPFWKALHALVPSSAPKPAPKALVMAQQAPAGEALSSWHLCPTKPNWAASFSDLWTPGEAGALAMLKRFGPQAQDYIARRDMVADTGTSRLSPHLHFGEISPGHVYHALDTWGYQRQLGWRDFSYTLLHNSPDLADAPWRASFARFPWANDEKDYTLWCRGKTGYPIVDAGMQQLWQTGWMHNRVRMIVASFLIKDLLCDWRWGERWFWDTLVDADLANNAAGWQWTAGSGADAAPYFRVFNPISQGQKFDPHGDYVRRWLPALAKLPARAIHAPWQAQPIECSDAGVRLGVDYPKPMIDHSYARQRALAAWREIKSSCTTL